MKLHKTGIVIGFFSTWFMTSVIALALADVPTVNTAGEKAFQAAFIASIISIGSIVFLGGGFRRTNYSANQTDDDKRTPQFFRGFLPQSKAVKALVAAAFVALISWLIFGRGNYNDCILENMKGVNNTQAAYLIRKACLDKYTDSNS
ncbi:hypothetical protein [Methylomicrobium lacus]|uniref:hypothetical protein n=1 Tax=Methylomicrobium lacus TaxID=136992 RepID=UPI0035A8AA1A